MRTDLLTREEDIAGEDSEETKELLLMLSEAVDFISRFDWSSSIVEKYLGYGVGGVFGLFLFRFSKPVAGTDEWLWVVVGDVPSAYFAIDNALNVPDAVAMYCDMMDQWCEAVHGGISLNDVYPVNAPASPEYATQLICRIEFIRRRILPDL